jgi:hypothetical protein
MGWDEGRKQITSFTNTRGVTFDLIRCYGQIHETTLKPKCDRFCSSTCADWETRAKQNNTMMVACLGNRLTTDAQGCLLTYLKEYTFSDVEYAPLMCKIITCLATIDTVATMQILCDNLHNLATYAVTVNGDINKIHTKFDKNHSRLLARAMWFHATTLSSTSSISIRTIWMES